MHSFVKKKYQKTVYHVNCRFKYNAVFSMKHSLYSNKFLHTLRLCKI